jgi:hypothetical protein|tara:strand:+ start:4539 stop:4739 length:201 start_codon:yes stop_codon:yes gene_type:complete
MNTKLPVIWHNYTGRIIAQSMVAPSENIIEKKLNYPEASHWIVAEHVADPENYVINKGCVLYEPVE